MNKNIKKKKFLIFLLIVFFLIINNFFYNIYYIAKSDFNDRMIFHYGYCYKNGYGFIKDIYQKYDINYNIKTYNNLTTPDSDWFFYDSNLKKDEKKIILLNFNLNLSDPNFIEFNSNKYKLIHSIENCYFLEKLYD